MISTYLCPHDTVILVIPACRLESWNDLQQAYMTSYSRLTTRHIFLMGTIDFVDDAITLLIRVSFRWMDPNNHKRPHECLADFFTATS